MMMSSNAGFRTTPVSPRWTSSTSALSSRSWSPHEAKFPSSSESELFSTAWGQRGRWRLLTSRRRITSRWSSWQFIHEDPRSRLQSFLTDCLWIWCPNSSGFTQAADVFAETMGLPDEAAASPSLLSRWGPVLTDFETRAGCASAGVETGSVP